MFSSLRSARAATIGLGLLVAALAAAPWSTTRADEPFLQFLDGLREREMFDAALMYLDDIEKSPLANETIKLRIPYERGKTLVDSTRSDRDPKSKGRALDQARDELQAFVKANPSHPFAGAATLELGKVVYERGRLYAEMMATPKNAPQKDQLAKQARTYFDESIKVFSDAETRFDKRLAELPKGAIDPKEKALVEEREQVRNDFVSANLFVAAVYQELAKTYPKTAKEFKDNMGKAVDKNKKIYERFRTRMGGQWAHVKQGECLQEMDEWKAAIGVYQDILAQPDDAPEFRKLQGAALYRKLQCHLEMKDYELAAKIGEEWLAKLRGQEDEQPDWLSGRYYTAFAEKHQADGLAEGDKNKAALLKTVRQHLQLVVRYPNRNRDDARQLLTSVTGKEDERKEPTNFAEAAERIQELREEMVVKEELAGKVGPGEKEEAAKAAAEIAKIRDDIMKYCNVALALRDKTTTAEQLMEIRYLLSYMYYQNGRYYDAAVLAEFLARRYPDRSLARPAAMIAVFAYLKEYQDPTPQIKESNQFERDKLSSLASFISTRWKDEPDAADAWAILVGVAVG
jgi:tetratricopeptide (TPR) repeat protein